MGFLGFGKKDRIVDLGERYRKKEEASKPESSDSFKILENSQSDITAEPSGSNGDSEFSGSPEENRKKLAKRLLDIGKKLDEISTQIYHIQQRVELLERKTGVRAGA